MVIAAQREDARGDRWLFLDHQPGNDDVDDDVDDVDDDDNAEDEDEEEEGDEGKDEDKEDQYRKQANIRR